ncbi:MAG TPA: hypothetical protein VN803_12095 [Gemmatimonadales bacterium]|nr:hypothetical protein [Gemmatimonadales bacterium]
MTVIDKFAPAWQFRELHRIAVLAPADAARRAIREVTAREIRLFRFLTWLRRLGRPSPEGLLNPPPDEPILKVALRTGFLQLANTEQELVLGTIVMSPKPEAQALVPKNPDEFLAITAPGYARAVMNFRVVESPLAMCVVTTETRVWATDEQTARKFALYWWTIRLGSGLIRRMWLRAIRRRAEKIGS